MRRILLVFLLLSCLSTYGQTGIYFLELENWEAAKNKAKIENKLIFVDFYTTWCVPCKEMELKVLSKKNVGDFFNPNFINLSVQLDKTNKDNAHVKKWYSDASFLKEKFKINTFPTYLFVNSSGEVVHSIETNFDTNFFIERARAALKPETQNVMLKKEYEAGRRDTAFLSLLIRSSQSSRDYNDVSRYTNDYLSKQTDLLTKDNLISIGKTTSKSTDIGFPILINHPNKIDSLFGKGYASGQISMIAFDEEILPIVRSNGKKILNNSMMYSYEGEPNKKVNWLEIKHNIEKKYPTFAPLILFDAKLNYYRSLNNWIAYCNEVDDYILKNPAAVDVKLLDRHANTILMLSEDTVCLKKALRWSIKANEMQNPPNPSVLYNYSGLLYRNGQKEQAIAKMKEAISSTNGKNLDYIKTLREMEKGEWE